MDKPQEWLNQSILDKLKELEARLEKLEKREQITVKPDNFKMYTVRTYLEMRGQKRSPEWINKQETLAVVMCKAANASYVPRDQIYFPVEILNRLDWSDATPASVV